MRLAYSYMRFSSARQQWGDSKRRQLDTTEEFCLRHKLTLDTSLTLHDFGMSAFRGKNLSEGGLGVFLQAIKEGKVKKGSVLIVENLDRFSRADPLEALGVFSKIIKAGVAIATTSNDTIVDAALLDQNEYHLMMIVGDLIRGHAESKRKSYFAKKCWTHKRTIAGSKKLTARCPLWLKLSEDKKIFKEIPSRVAVVKKIFAKVIDGYGATKIAKWLNREKIPCFWNGEHWQQSSVAKVVHNRSVTGEYQPHELRFDGAKPKRVPIGDPVPNYYPTIIDEDTFNMVQKAMAARKNHVGNVGKKIANIFTGLVIDARDGHKLHIVIKHEKQLVNGGAVHGVEGAAEYRGFSYELFERAVLSDLREITVKDLLPRPQQVENESEKWEAKLVTVQAKIAKLQQRIEGEADADALIVVVVNLTRQEKQIKAELQMAKQEESSTVADDLHTAQSILEMMDADPSDEVRTRLKAKIAVLVKKIYVVVFDETVEDFSRKGRSKTFRFIDVQIVYVTGEMRRLVLEQKTGFVMGSDQKTDRTHIDLRNYQNWYETDTHRWVKVFKTCCMAMLMEHLKKKDHFMRYWAEFCELAKKEV